MRLLRNELYKVISSHLIISLFFLLILCNGSFFLYEQFQNKDLASYSPFAYASICRDYAEMTDDAVFLEVSKQLEKMDFFTDLLYGDVTEYADIYTEQEILALIEEFNEGSYLVYTDNIWQEKALYEDISSEIENVMNYQTYLNELKERAEAMGNLSIFSDTGGFSYKNLQKTAEDFQHLNGNNLKFSTSKGVTEAADFLATDFIMVLLLLILVGILFGQERELGQLALIKGTYNGRGYLTAVKLAAAIICTLFMTVTLYGSTFLLSGFLYGFGDMERYVQSLQGYIGCNLILTVKEYLLCYFGLKMLSCVALLILFFAVSACVHDLWDFYLLMAGLMSVSAVLYLIISPQSWLSLLRYLNIIAFLRTKNILVDYLNLNLFGLPVSYLKVCIIIISILLFVSAAVFIKRFKKSENAEYRISILKKLRNRFSSLRLPRLHSTVSLLTHELYKLLIGGKVLWILIGFLLFTMYSYHPMKVIYPQEKDLFYRQYMLELEGPVTLKKEKILENEQKRYQELDLQMQENAKTDSGSLTALEYEKQKVAQEGFEMVLQVYEYLKTTQSGEFVYEAGYNLLTRGEGSGTKDIQLGLIMSLLLILCISRVYSVEYQNNEIVLLKTAYKGRKETFLAKLGASVLVGSYLYVITYLPYIYNVLSTYGTSGMNASIVSLIHLNALPEWVSIKGYLVGVALVRYIGMLLTVMVIILISIWQKSLLRTLMICTVIILLPLLLSFIGLQIFDYILLNPFYIGNIFTT